MRTIKFYLPLMLIAALVMDSLKTYADSWVQKANFGGFARVSATSFGIGGYVYIGTGLGYRYDSTYHYTNDFWEYDQGSNTWTQKANFGGTARESASGFAIGTKGYIGTGWDSSGVRNDFWEYDQGS